jgi:hypothetical protein
MSTRRRLATRVPLDSAALPSGRRPTSLIGSHTSSSELSPFRHVSGIGRESQGRIIGGGRNHRPAPLLS